MASVETARARQCLGEERAWYTPMLSALYLMSDFNLIETFSPSAWKTWTSDPKQIRGRVFWSVRVEMAPCHASSGSFCWAGENQPYTDKITTVPATLVEMIHCCILSETWRAPSLFFRWTKAIRGLFTHIHVEKEGESDLEPQSPASNTWSLFSACQQLQEDNEMCIWWLGSLDFLIWEREK